MFGLVELGWSLDKLSVVIVAVSGVLGWIPKLSFVPRLEVPLKVCVVVMVVVVVVVRD